MNAWLVYTVNNRGAACPQVIFGTGTKPFLDEGIRGRVLPSQQQLTAGEVSDLLAGAIGLDKLTERYPAPEVLEATS